MGAMAAVEPDYAPGSLVTNAWFANQGAEEQKADLWFIKAMRPHHAGALSMSKEYLSSKNASNAKLKVLAGGIMTNQTFEIGMMNRGRAGGKTFAGRFRAKKNGVRWQSRAWHKKAKICPRTHANIFWHRKHACDQA